MPEINEGKRLCEDFARLTKVKTFVITTLAKLRKEKGHAWNRQYTKEFSTTQRNEESRNSQLGGTQNIFLTTPMSFGDNRHI